MSSSSVTPSTDEFDAEFERVLQQRMLKRQNDLDKIISPQASLWMALAPGWTLPLAGSCGFPDLSEQGEYLFEQMLSQKMVEVYPLQGANQQPLKYYEMVPNSRAEILQRFLSGQSENVASQQRPNRLLEQVMKKAQKQAFTPRSPAEELVDLTAEIGERMYKAGLSSPGILPQLLSDWSRLASRANNPTALIDLFNAEVQAAFDQRKIGPIINWLEKARPLAALLEYALRPELSVAIDQAGRRIELLKRQANDFRHLSSFLRREEQVRVVMDMMNGPDEYWALHFIGAGGVGKTMIIRYITCLLTGGKDAPCLQDEMPFKEPVAVARIDFDYLNPDYPRLRPGLLLWSLAQELRPYDQSGGRANALFDEANRLLDQLHALVANTGLAPGERASRHPIFIDAMMQYIEALKILGPRVLLILDTCEELSKASPEDEPNRNVSETLDILRALHDGAGTLSADANQSSPGSGVNSMRMICSGRRLLAGSGPGWKASSSNRLPPCSFLRIHEIRGFPYPEAEGFLRRSKVPENLIPAVIQASSPDPRGNIVIEWENPADKPADVPRCSPYQLHLYMDWSREDPPPKPEALTGAAEGHYVELRILQRLNDANLVRLLPVVALLGHFDRDSLYAGVGGNAQDFDPAFDALQEQDWISSRLVSTGQDADGQEAAGRRVLDVESSIRDHMRVYFERRGQILPAARRRAASFLQKRTLEDPLESLEWTDYDAALRASDADLEQAVSWWQRLETRLFDAYLAEKQNPEALHTLLQTLSGRDGACGMRDPQAGAEIPSENRLRPFVMAALAAVQQFMPEPARRRDTWRQVEEIVMRQSGADGTIPLDAGAHRLLRLSLAGQVAVAHDPGSDLDAGLVNRFLGALERADLHDSQELAALAAAFEALIERAERREAPGQPANTISSHLARFTAHLPADPEVSRLYHWSFSLQGRAYRLDQALEPALAALKTSLLEISEKDTPFSYRYWKQPADLAARLRLEFIRAAYPLLLSPAEIMEIIPIRAETPLNADQENLLAISIQTQVRARTPGGGELDAWLKSQGETFGCTCNAHRETPPLLVALAEALFSAGRVDEAMRKLEETRFRDYDARLWVARARIELSIRMRQWSYGQADANLLLEASRPEDMALLLRASAVEGRPHNVIPGTLDPHRLWQVDSPPADPGRLAEWITSWNQRVTAASGSATGLALEALQLDLVELDKIAQTAGLHFDRSDSRQRWSPGDWGQRIGSAMAAPHAGLRLALRLRELVIPQPVPGKEGGRLYNPPESLESTQLDYLTTNLTARLGERQSAEIALEEAELLGLRLPGAEIIWSAAAEQFKTAGDTGGEFRALVGQLVHQTASAKSPQAAKQVGRHPIFKRCEEVYAVLPDARPLDEVDRYLSSGSPESSLLGFLKPLAWVPWQAYWAAVRMIVSGADLTPLRLEIESNYSRSSGDRIQLPREWEQLFRFAIRPASSSQDRQAVPASTPRSQPRSQPRSYLVLIVIFSLAFTAALLVGGFFLFRLTTQSFMGSVSTGTQVWIYLGVLLGIIVLVQVYRILRAWWNTLGFYELEIRPAQEQSKESSRSSASMRLRLSRWAPRVFPFPPRLRYAAIAEDQLLASSGSTASRLSENIKERIFGKALLKAAAPQRASIPVTLRLKLSADAAAPAWEAVWAQVIRGDEAKPSRLKMRFIRVLQRSRTSPGDTSAETGRPAVGALTPVPAAQQVLNQAWSEQNKRGTVNVQVVSDIRAPQNQIQILHIIARVENQLGGPVLNLSSTDPSPSNIGRETLHKTSDWLNPGQLISLFPGVTLCLLQGDPAAFLETYAESSILSAEQTRRFAADLAAEGITVLVLPPVPPRLAADLGTRLARVAPAFSRRGSAALVGVLRDLQNRIHSGIENKTTGWSLALDACLYANDLPNPSFGEEMSKKMDPFESSMLEQKAKKPKSGKTAA